MSYQISSHSSTVIWSYSICFVSPRIVAAFTSNKAENEKLQTTNLVLEQKVNELQQKASFYDLILQNKSLLTVSQITKDVVGTTREGALQFLFSELAEGKVPG